MRHGVAIYTVLVSALAFVASPAEAQDVWPISFDVRGGYGFPVGDFGDDFEGGWGFGAGAVLTLTPSIGVYGGWARDTFGCDLVGCDDDELRVSGFEIGGKFTLPRGAGTLPWAKVGLIAHKAEFDGGLIESESDREYGFQAAVGVDVPLGEVLSVSPALRYNRLSFGDDLLEDDPDVQYLALDIGAHIHIPRN